METFQNSWDDFELFAEYAEGARGDDNVYSVRTMGDRTGTIDFNELLELLRSLQLLSDRGDLFDPRYKFSVTHVHAVFEAVNDASFTAFFATGGEGGDGQRNELVFDEYRYPSSYRRKETPCIPSILRGLGCWETGQSSGTNP